MNIIKSLNLNKTPQSVPNGSLVFAKNIKLSPDSSFITNEEGLSSVISGIDGEIKGVIPCNKELIIFTYDSSSGSNIYRCKEQENTKTLTVTEITSHNWSYCNDIHGKPKVDTRINGTYTYNVNNELIVCIGEYPVDDNDYKSYNIPLRSANFGIEGTTSVTFFDISEDIPFTNMRLDDDNPYANGISIPTGVYQFFIRYKLSKDSYSKWFPIGVPYYAMRLENKTIINHSWIPDTGFDDDPSEGLDEDNPLLNPNCTVSRFVNNTLLDSDYSFNFKLYFYPIVNNVPKFNGKIFQLAYILQKDDGAVGRLYKEYKISGTSTSITFDGKYKEELDINDIVDNVFSLYNVKNLCNYDNRVYISNYKETVYNESSTVLINAAKSISHTWTYSPYPSNGGSQFSSQNVKGYVNQITIGNSTIKITGDIGSGSAWDDAVYKIHTYGIYEALSKIFVPRQYNVDGVIVSYGFNKCKFKNANGTYIVSSDNVYACKDSNNDQVALVTKYNGAWIRVYPFVDSSQFTPEIIEYEETHITVDVNTTTSSSGGSSSYDPDSGQASGSGGSASANSNSHTASDTTTVTKTNLIQEESLDLSLTNWKVSEYEIHNVSNGGTYKFFRTFIPYENYRFFIHYLRSDGSFTNGIPIPDTPNGNNYDISCNLSGAHTLSIIGINFSGITIPSGYIGFFISYAKVEPTIIYSAICTYAVADNGYAEDTDKLMFKASEVEFGLTGFTGLKYKILYNSSDNGTTIEWKNYPWKDIGYCNIVTSNSKVTDGGTDIINTVGTHGGIILSGFNDNGTPIAKNDIYYPKKGDVILVKGVSGGEYTDINKDLISLGPICAPASTSGTFTYGTQSGHLSDYNSDLNYPGFICCDEPIMFKYRIAIGADNKPRMIKSGMIAPHSLITAAPYANLLSYVKYSRFNLSATSNKTDNEEAVIALKDRFEAEVILHGQRGEAGYGNYARVMLQDSSMENAAVNENADASDVYKYVTTFVRPENLTDLFQLRSQYIEEIHKLYTNYDENREEIEFHHNTIRRSNVIRDQSTENTWRIFEAMQYKEINNNKGFITNITGIGNLMIIHTEHTLFVLDRNSFLKTDDKNIQLAMPDTFDVEPQEVLTGNHGYGGLQNIYAWCINHHGYWYYDKDDNKIYRFNEGNIDDLTPAIVRLLNNYNFTDARFITDFDNNRVIICLKVDNKYFTLSYEYNINQFISIHDYYFDEAYNTKNRLYLFSVDDGDKLFDFGNSIGNYSSLILPGTSKNITNYPARVENGKCYSYVDIIFNILPEESKSLEFIIWVINKISNYNSQDDDVQAEENLENHFDNDVEHYAGDIMQIYSDLCNTGLLDINVGNKINIMNNYKYPYYDSGIWNFNFFRNRIGTSLTDTELAEVARILGTTVRVLKNGLITVTDGQGNIVYRYSDYRQLVYGKYFVIRFMFKPDDNNKHIKFENVGANIKRY